MYCRHLKTRACLERVKLIVALSLTNATKIIATLLVSLPWYMHNSPFARKFLIDWLILSYKLQLLRMFCVIVYIYAVDDVNPRPDCFHLSKKNPSVVINFILLSANANFSLDNLKIFLFCKVEFKQFRYSMEYNSRKKNLKQTMKNESFSQLSLISKPSPLFHVFSLVSMSGHLYLVVCQDYWQIYLQRRFL